jgi:2-polyprenyl-6-methoxyphenol hydroxylase-like FAD-dependent oxidoreductase
MPSAQAQRSSAIATKDTGCGVTALIRTRDGECRELDGALLIGAEGLHSAVRAQMHPDQPPIQWGGTIMWRGTTPGVPIRTGASFVGLGTHRHRVVFYPISERDPVTGLATINWIATRAAGAMATGTRRVEVDAIHHFWTGTYDWLDVPAMLRGAGEVFEYPMIDRDPVATWVDGHVALLGDAAHVMYPTGSNGASPAVMDARLLGTALLEHGITPRALQAYDAQLCGEISAVVLCNRGAGPFGLLNLLHERCGGVFDDIDAVIPPAERDAFMSCYKAAAGFAKEHTWRPLQQNARRQPARPHAHAALPTAPEIRT